MIRGAHRVLWWMVLCAGLTHAQTLPTARTWVMFRDKDSEASKLLSAPSLGISERALQRRAKVLPPDRLIDELDYPVTPAYLDRLRAKGLVVRSTSRWLNAASVEGAAATVGSLLREPFVASVRPVSVQVRARDAELPAVPVAAKIDAGTTLSYGVSLTQHTRTGVVDVHRLRINGNGVVVGFADDGFNFRTTHEALKHLPVLAEYDFVQRDNNTSVAPGEYATQGHHGRNCLSIAAGYAEGTLLGGQSLVGAAYGISVILAKTEIDSVEIRAEEDSYVEALEWMERLGADIISTSLGYDDFDPRGYSPNDVFYRQKDGRTATTTNAARIAARKGVLLVTAMGNEGWNRKDSTWTTTLNATGSLVTPADADSIVAVGAATSSGTLATFSSTGPTADGRIKPEVVNQGVGVYYASDATNGFAMGNGTSYATPLTAGAAALVLSAHPYLTPMQVREALVSTARRDISNAQAPSYPNNYYGWGYVNALAAVLYWGPVFSNRPTIISNDTAFIVTSFIRASGALRGDSLFVHYRKPGQTTYSRMLLRGTGVPDEYCAAIPRTQIDSLSTGYFSGYDIGGRSFRQPYNAPAAELSLQPTGSSRTPAAPRPAGTVAEFRLGRYPNPFNGSVTLVVETPVAEEIDLAVYDILGRRVATLYRGAVGPGAIPFVWRGMNDAGGAAGSGVYLARVSASGTVRTEKLVYLK